MINPKATAKTTRQRFIDNQLISKMLKNQLCQKKEDKNKK
jgi:hypothetical protein